MNISNNEKYLNLRVFSDKQKKEYFEAHKIMSEKIGEYVCKCKRCGEEMIYTECQADHKNPWSRGGKTTRDNLQFLCKKCNSEKNNKY